MVKESREIDKVGEQSGAVLTSQPEEYQVVATEQTLDQDNAEMETGEENVETLIAYDAENNTEAEIGDLVPHVIESGKKHCQNSEVNTDLQDMPSLK